MMRFEEQTYLFYLAIIPVVVFVLYHFYKERSKLFKKWGNTDTFTKIVSGYNSDFPKYRNILTVLALFFCILALANFQWGFHNEELKSNTTDVFIAVDISRSMDANDVAFTRIGQAKKFCTELIQKLKGNNISLILFARSAYMQIPLTSDYAAVSMMVNSISTDQVGTQGTSISEVATLVESTMKKQNKQSAKLIILTDGEDHEGNAVDAVEELKKYNVTTYCIGVGTKEGGYIPEGNAYKMDENMKPVVTKVNVDMVNDIANAGGGRAFSIQDEKAVATIEKDIAETSKNTSSTKSFNDYNSFFQIFVLLALICLIAEYILSKWYYLKKEVNA